MFQGEFNDRYDRLKGYGCRCARRYFSDESLATDAVDKGMDKFVDALMVNPEISDKESENIIRDSIRNSRITCKLEPIKLGFEEYGFHGYRVAR
jgi:hypothetical protein